jgi:hypothetical protein
MAGWLKSSFYSAFLGKNVIFTGVIFSPSLYLLSYLSPPA